MPQELPRQWPLRIEKICCVREATLGFHNNKVINSIELFGIIGDVFIATDVTNVTDVIL